MQLLQMPQFTKIQQLSTHFSGIKRGIEKESLRITEDGMIAETIHPEALGATLTNAHITTDYSEALPEFITAASDDRLKPLKDLLEIHQFTYRNIGDELLWVNSMPCVMGEEDDIPIAQYGKSNSGQMKEIYRVGLGHRYGRFMQTIAGVHYNFSLPESFWQAMKESEESSLPLQDFIDQKYMGLIRNYLRHSWLIPLFFGASPALCESFIKEENIDLDELVPGTKYGAYATSLRMSDLGYQNNAQSALDISYNSLDRYIEGLEKAISTPDPYYQELGVQERGEYKQLNANVLQIENEFYSSIRPKRVTQSGERPSKALRNRGVEYIEVRALDLNPFSPIGITQSQIAFLDAFLLACLFADSPPINSREKGEFQTNFKTVVYKGRHPDCCLTLNNRCVPLKEVAKQLLEEIQPCSELLDNVYSTEEHMDILMELRAQLENLDETLSGKIVKSIEEKRDGFFPFAMNQAIEHKETILDFPFDPKVQAYFENEAKVSIETKRKIEEEDSMTFEEFLGQYYG